MNEPVSAISRSSYRNNSRNNRLGRSSLILAWILLAGGILRLGVTLRTSDASFVEGDGLEYRDLARNLATGHGYSISFYRWFEPVPPGADPLHPELYRPPLLPLVGAPLFFLPGSWTAWARAETLVLSLLGIGLIYLLGKALHDQRSALLAAAVLAAYPFAIFYSSKWLTETLCLDCTLAALLFLAWSRRGQREFLYPFAGGICLGLGTLARPQSVLLLPVLLLWLLLARRPLTARKRLTPSLMALAGAFLALAPWGVRNARLTGEPTPTTCFAPYNLWLGMNDQVLRMYTSGESRAFPASMDSLFHDSKRHVRRLEQGGVYDFRHANARWLEWTRDYVAAHPDRAVSILGHRALHFFRPWPNRSTVPAVVFWAALLTTGPLMGLAGAGLLLRREARDPLLLLPVLTTFLGCIPFIFHLRFRFPVFDPCMILMASPSLASLAARAAVLGRRRRKRRTGEGPAVLGS